MTKCHECRFWICTNTWGVPLEENPDWDGECHRHPPATWNRWPKTSQGDCCGEGEPKEGEG